MGNRDAITSRYWWYSCTRGEENWKFGYEREESEYIACAVSELGVFGMYYTPFFKKESFIAQLPLLMSSYAHTSLPSRLPQSWTLIYSLDQHGIPLNTTEHFIYTMQRSFIAFASSPLRV